MRWVAIIFYLENEWKTLMAHPGDRRLSRLGIIARVECLVAICKPEAADEGRC